MTVLPQASGAWALPVHLGLHDEVESLKDYLDAWVRGSEPDIQEMLAYQLAPSAKFFRPVTIFACHRAATALSAPNELIQLAAAVELFHNYTLVVDDIVDRDRYRRGRLALHCRYGVHPGLAVAAYLAYGAARLVAADEDACRVFDQLGRRIAVAECRQWRLRGKALSVEQWRRLAGEDTGGMFEACARVAARDGVLNRFGLLLGILYHGCDDVADIRGTVALGTVSEKDVNDRILTLPAALATRDPYAAELFEEGGPEANAELGELFASVLDEAEAVLDELAAEAEREAQVNALEPDILLELVRFTRTLSRA